MTLTFTISFFFLGCTAFLGGLWLNRKGPKIVAMTAGVLWGGGVFLASFAAHKLGLLYLSYGVIGEYRPRPRLHRTGRSSGEMVSQNEEASHQRGSPLEGLAPAF